MRVLMLVATGVATDTRVLREAGALVEQGHVVDIIGRSVPSDFVPPEGITVHSVGTSSVFRRQGGPSWGASRLPWHRRLVRYVLLPQHRNSAFGRWAESARQIGESLDADVVHTHDFNALEAGAALAQAKGVPLIYDTHELWSGRPREHRPTPLQDRRERRVEKEIGDKAHAVITVGDGVADALRERYRWSHVHVVRNTFPDDSGSASSRSDLPETPKSLLYAGRLAAFRELEVIAAASDQLPLPVDLIGPADETWLRSFDPGAANVHQARPVAEVDDLLVAAGLSLVTHSDQWENHRLALPNKLFHAVSLGIPVVATDVGELGKIVRAYGLGTLYRPGHVDDLVRAVQQAVADYGLLRQAVAEAATDLSWATDARTLTAIYETLKERP